MAIEGELSGVGGATCDCGRHMDLSVCRSAAGYYMGYWCNQCGPWSRESGYYRSRQEADAALQAVKSGSVVGLRNTKYGGG